MTTATTKLARRQRLSDEDLLLAERVLEKLQRAFQRTLPASPASPGALTEGA